MHSLVEKIVIQCHTILFFNVGKMLFSTCEDKEICGSTLETVDKSRGASDLETHIHCQFNAGTQHHLFKSYKRGLLIGQI